MLPWQITVLWALIIFEALGVAGKVSKASRGVHVTRETPGINAASAVIETLIFIFLLTLVL